MLSIGNITSATQAIHAAAAIKKVVAASDAASTRDSGDNAHGPPGGYNVTAAGKGGVIDVYG